jgi:hypothetical protein
MNADNAIRKWILFGLCLVMRGSGVTWIDKYEQEAAAMNKACQAKEYATCRGHLLRLEELLDGRADIVYRLAKVEANLGNKEAALVRLAIFSMSGLMLGDASSEPARRQLD